MSENVGSHAHHAKIDNLFNLTYVFKRAVEAHIQKEKGLNDKVFAAMTSPEYSPGRLWRLRPSI